MLTLAFLLACSGEPATPPTPPPAPIDVHEAPAPTPTPPVDSACQASLQGWCPGVPGDACGAHADAAACQADPNCEGLPYTGESFVPCELDDRCFATNCPTTGCRSRCEILDRAACGADPRCAWSGTSCARVDPCSPKTTGG